MTRIHLVTCATYPGLSESDSRYAEALTQLGADVTAADWQAGVGSCRGADLIVIRSPWDYHRDIGAYQVWLDALEKEGLRVANPLPLVRWNLDKSYLHDVMADGVPAPAQFVVRRDPEAVRTAMATAGWSQAVIKPAIGASGHGVELVKPDTLEGLWPAIDAASAPHAIVVQEFLPEIREHGQVSFVFLNGQFSHAVRFMPAGGEFRINARLEPVIEAVDPHPPEIEQAARVVGVLPLHPLYARIDMVRQADTLLVLEVEVHEPGLLFQFVPKAAKTFAKATMQWLRATPGEQRGSESSSRSHVDSPFTRERDVDGGS